MKRPALKLEALFWVFVYVLRYNKFKIIGIICPLQVVEGTRRCVHFQLRVKLAEDACFWMGTS